MSRWRGWILAVLAVGVGVGGVLLLLAVNAAATGEGGGDIEEIRESDEAIRSERITPPGQRPMVRPPTPRPRPATGPAARPPAPSPTFRFGGIPPVAGETMTPDQSDLQAQLANRRLAALERRVRAMKRRIDSMISRESAPERIEAQKSRMEALMEEIQQKRQEMGMPAFDLEDEE